MVEDVVVDVVELTLADLVARSRALLSGRDRAILGVAGAPGAGKSTVTAALTAALGEECVVVPMDGFHLSNEVLRGLGRRERKGAPDTFDVPGYRALLERLRAQEELVYAPAFDRQLEESIGSALPVPGRVPLVITEGNYLLHEEHGWEVIRPLLDEVWYLDVPLEEIQRRLVARRLGHGDPEDAARSWVHGVDTPNAHRVRRDRHRADLVIRLLD